MLMMEIEKYELYEIVGGGSFANSSFLNAISRFLSTALQIGQTVGSSIRRLIDKKVCKC
mgnify:CR=1 FL=1